MITVSAFTALVALSGDTRGDGRMHIWILDVGQGDSIVVETPGGRVMVVDAGPAFQNYDAGERVVAPALWARGYLKADSLLVTHRHTDHAGGAAFIARHFRPDRFIVNGPSDEFATFSPRLAARGARWAVDGISLNILAPGLESPKEKRDENGASLVVDVRFGATSVLLLGDADARAEELAVPEESRFDVVKVAHHGAATSSSVAVVHRTHPRFAVISVGARNRFGHPNREVVSRWRREGARVLRTDRDRTIHLVSDGSSFRLETNANSY